jgi:PAC2 family
MDEVEFHREPPTTIPTMVVGFGGWIDAGEAVTGAIRALVRQLGAVPLAAIDPEDFFDCNYPGRLRAPMPSAFTAFLGKG